MASPLIEAAKKLRKRRQEVVTAISKAERTARPAGKPSISPGGTTAEQAKRTKRTGKEGEPAFGAPLTTVPSVNGETPKPFIDTRVVRPDPLKPRKDKKK